MHVAPFHVSLIHIRQWDLTNHSPGWVWTPMNGEGAGKEKPDGSWTAAQTVEYALPKILDQNEFYVICPDGETSTVSISSPIERLC